MFRFQIHHRYLASILMLLTLISSASIFSPSAKTPVAPSGWIGLMTNDKGIDPKPTESPFVMGSKPEKEPILLRYLTRLVGDDWLGADWMYIGLGDYRYLALDKNDQQLYVTNPVTGAKIPQWNYARFWTDPGPALLKAGDTLWIWGYDAGSHTIYADSILVNPPSRVAPTDDVGAFGSILTVKAQTITVQDPEGIRSTVTVDPYTTYSFPKGEGLPRPQDGLWLNISWLTGNAGLLGRYDGFHGTYRGILRLDFTQP